MDGRLFTAQCRTTDFAAIESTLREWPEVEAVGSFREKSNNKKDLTTVFVTFANEDAAKGANEKISSIKELIVSEGAGSEPKTKNSSNQQKRNKNMAAEYMKFDSYEERKRAEEAGKRRGRGNGRSDRGGRGRATGESGTESGADSAFRGRGRGRGGRGGGGRGSQRQQAHQDQQQPQQQQQQQPIRGRSRNQNYQRLPPLEASVAFADNIPFGTTNDAIMELFAPYGQVLDINRLELMAMVCYDNPEAVQQCIQHLNGTKINGNTITVSSGVVRIPGNAAAYLGM